MSDLSVTQGDGSVSLEFDEALYPRDAIYGAAYIFLDRCYVHLDRPAGGRVSVRLRLKPSSSAVLGELAGEFENELLGQAWRRQILDENRTLIERISARAAAGSAGPPGLDDLLNVDAGAEAFDDPLGIAMSWEEKYKKKGETRGEGEGEGKPGEARTEAARFEAASRLEAAARPEAAKPEAAAKLEAAARLEAARVKDATSPEDAARDEGAASPEGASKPQAAKPEVAG